MAQTAQPRNTPYTPGSIVAGSASETISGLTTTIAYWQVGKLYFGIHATLVSNNPGEYLIAPQPDTFTSDRIASMIGVTVNTAYVQPWNAGVFATGVYFNGAWQDNGNSISAILTAFLAN